MTAFCVLSWVHDHHLLVLQPSLNRFLSGESPLRKRFNEGCVCAFLCACVLVCGCVGVRVCPLRAQIPRHAPSLQPFVSCVRPPSPPQKNQVRRVPAQPLPQQRDFPHLPQARGAAAVHAQRGPHRWGGRGRCARSSLVVCAVLRACHRARACVRFCVRAMCVCVRVTACEAARPRPLAPNTKRLPRPNTPSSPFPPPPNPPGFHTFDYARHFLSCCSRMLGLEHQTARGSISVEYYGRNVGIKIMPTGEILRFFADLARLYVVCLHEYVFCKCDVYMCVCLCKRCVLLMWMCRKMGVEGSLGGAGLHQRGVLRPQRGHQDHAHG
jgi:hypothetical protein